MSDLTDEQIDRDISELRIQHGPAIDRFIAAVTARAKRIERAEVVGWLYALAANFTDPQASSALAYAAAMLENKEATDAR